MAQEQNKYVAINARQSVDLCLLNQKIEAFYTEEKNSGMNIKGLKQKNVVVEDKKMRIVEVIMLSIKLPMIIS